MTGPTETRAPWVRLTAEAYWTAQHELPNVRVDLRLMVQAHVERLRRLLEATRSAA